MILKDKREYYLCDDQNFLYLQPFYGYDIITGYELGSYNFLFYDMNFFEYTQGHITGVIIVPTNHFF